MFRYQMNPIVGGWRSYRFCWCTQTDCAPCDRTGSAYRMTLCRGVAIDNVVQFDAWGILESFMIYNGRPLMFSLIRLTYSPIIPIPINWMPPIKIMVIICDAQPGSYPSL